MRVGSPNSHTNQSAPAPKARLARGCPQNSFPRNTTVLSSGLSKTPETDTLSTSTSSGLTPGGRKSNTAAHTAPPPTVRSLGSPTRKKVRPRPRVAGSICDTAPVLDVRHPDAPRPEGDGSRVHADRHLGNELVRRRVDHPDRVGGHRGGSTVAVAAAARRRETGGDSRERECGRTDEHPAMCPPRRSGHHAQAECGACRGEELARAGVAPAGVLGEGSGEDRVEPPGSSGRACEGGVGSSWTCAQSSATSVALGNGAVPVRHS